ncbi:MAG: hypothetical protein HOY71_54680 [Nonomuraea sp.]|nr:hypothetical protein [Nonomuraea sp.]
MIRKALPIAMLALLGACATEPPRAAPTPPATPTPTSTPTPQAVDPTPSTCALVDHAAYTQLLTMTLIIGRKTRGRALRETVAESYRTYATDLAGIVTYAPDDLARVLKDWSAASEAVADYVARHEPRPGAVLDLGPPHSRWEKVRKSAEKLCGHELPRTSS